LGGADQSGKNRENMRLNSAILARAYPLLLFCCCVVLRPAALSQADYLGPVPDYDNGTVIESWLLDEYLYFALRAPVPGGNAAARQWELWVAHLPTGQTSEVVFPNGERFHRAAQHGDALYCYASAGGQGYLFRLREGAYVPEGTAVPFIRRFVPTPGWELGIAFFAEHSNGDWRLWRSDGSPSGTAMLAAGLDVHASFEALGDKLLFGGAGQQLFASDGTVSGTLPIKVLGGEVRDLRRYDEALLFNLGSQGVWRTDGTAAGTYALVPGRTVTAVSVAAGRALLQMSRLSNGKNEIWSTDGTPDGTQMLLTQNDYFTRVFALNDQHYIMGRESSAGPFQCWRTDGTPGGTVSVLPAAGFERLQLVSRVSLVQGQWAFLEGDTDEQLSVALAFDGEAAHPIDCWSGSAAMAFGRETDPSFMQFALRYSRIVGDHLYSPMMHPTAGVELWRFNRDGSADLVADIAPGVRWAHPRLLAELDGQLYFLGKSPAWGPALFRAPIDDLAGQPQAAPTEYRWLQSLVPSRSWHNEAYTSTVFSSQPVVSSAGHVYVAGERNGLAGLGFSQQEIMLPPADRALWRPSVHYLAKLDGATGRVLWAHNIAYDLGKFYAHDLLLAPAPDDGVYTSQVFRAEAHFSDTTFQTNNPMTYLARYDSTGRTLWQLDADFGESGGPLGLLASEDGEIILAGNFYFFQGRLGATQLSGTSSPAVFLARLSPVGELKQVAEVPLPPHWSNAGWSSVLKRSPDGRIGLLLSRSGHNIIQDCGYAPSEIQLYCFTPDLKGMAWQREFRISDLAYGTTIDFDAAGRLYMAGRYRGEFAADGLSISAPCNKPTSFVAVLSHQGRLMQLFDLAPIQATIYDLKLEADGTYLLAGIEEHEERDRNYEGYEGQPFASGAFSSFVQRRCAYEHELLGERRFLKTRAQQSQKHNPRLALMPDGSIVFQDRLSEAAVLDTLAGVPYLYRSNPAAVLNFDLPASGDCKSPEEELERQELTFHIGPNPTTGQAWLYPPLEIDARELRLSLQNIAGQPVPLRHSGASTYRQIDLSHLPAGLYLLKVAHNSRQWILKIVKL
jgi:outer membrane protein assembly factor BamB